jgi:hypothetical protein
VRRYRLEVDSTLKVSAAEGKKSFVQSQSRGEQVWRMRQIGNAPNGGTELELTCEIRKLRIGEGGLAREFDSMRAASQTKISQFEREGLAAIGKPFRATMGANGALSMESLSSRPADSSMDFGALALATELETTDRAVCDAFNSMLSNYLPAVPSRDESWTSREQLRAADDGAFSVVHTFTFAAAKPSRRDPFKIFTSIDGSLAEAESRSADDNDEARGGPPGRNRGAVSDRLDGNGELWFSEEGGYLLKRTQTITRAQKSKSGTQELTCTTKLIFVTP